VSSRNKIPSRTLGATGNDGLPFYKAQYARQENRTMTDPIHTQIQHTIDTHSVVLFMKGTADFPMCGFSATVCNVLEQLNVPFHDVNVMADENIRQGIKTFSNWPTIPQLYVKGQFIGGCDIVREMYQSGELQTLLQEQGVLAAA
jgi:monothiol glutaredoxin